MADEVTVHLFSGGLDSCMTATLYPADVYVHIVTGTEENSRERSYLGEWAASSALKTICMDLSAWERENKIIPFRNHFMLLAAAQYGNVIYFSATAGDTTKDKDQTFRVQMQSVLNYFCTGPADKLPQHGNRQFKIEMPLLYLTKGDAVRQYLSNGGDGEKLALRSRSCYVGGEKECGTCRACLRKYVALRWAGLQNALCQRAFTSDPRYCLVAFLEESRRKKRSSKEIEQIEAIAEG